jgi:hypothetical protein
MKSILSRKILSIFGLVFFLSLPSHAQQTQAQLLKEPAAWQFERFPLPPTFTPDFSYKGVEELRFSPGMFNKDSTDYFTYAFVAELDNVTSISQNDIRQYLLDYFKGLCSSTAKNRNIVIDTSKIMVVVSRKKDAPSNEITYDALLNIFGVFADGAPVKLNMEVEVLPDEKTKKVYLVFIASPLDKKDKVWNELYKIREDFLIPG